MIRKVIATAELKKEQVRAMNGEMYQNKGRQSERKVERSDGRIDKSAFETETRGMQQMKGEMRKGTLQK